MIRSALVLLSFAAALAVAAPAQLQLNPRGSAPPPAPTAKPKPPLQGMARIQYIVKQLNLDLEQKKHCDALIETYYSGSSSGSTIDINKIRAMADQMKAAQDAGNTAEYNRLQEELKAMGQGSTDEPEFLENLKKVLKPDQIKTLESTVERLKNNPSGSLRAIDVVRTARSLGLNEKQATDLEAAVVAHRNKVNDTTAPRDATPPDAKMAAQLDEFIAAVRAVLSPEQAGRFDASIAAMKTETAAAAPAPKAAP